MNAPALAGTIDPGLDHPEFCGYHGTESLCDHHDGIPTTVPASAGEFRLYESTLQVGHVEVGPVKTERGTYGVNLLVVNAAGQEVEVQFHPAEWRALCAAGTRDLEIAEQAQRVQFGAVS